MSTRGQRAVRDALARQRDELAQSFVAKAPVTAVGTKTVTVLFPGDTVAQTWPRLRSYSDAAVGDVAVMVGAPGAWVAHGALA